MPRTKKNVPQTPQIPEAVEEVLNQHAEPLALIEEMETAHDTTSDPYWEWIDGLMGAALATVDVDSRDDAKHLLETRGDFWLARSARHAGFAIGFAYAMNLKDTSGGDLKELLSGARPAGGVR